MEMKQREYLTSSDVARIAIERGVALTPAGVRLAAATGRLPAAACTPGGVRLFERSDVDAFIQAREARRTQRNAPGRVSTTANQAEE